LKNDGFTNNETIVQYMNPALLMDYEHEVFGNCQGICRLV